MQTVKDSFFSALSDRLAVLNPSRTVVIEGLVRPAVVVLENELATTAPREPETFYLTWTAAKNAKGGINVPQPLVELDCEIAYWTEGSEALSYQDRGRSLASLDDELLAISSPGNAGLKDFSVTPPAGLSAAIFWTQPELGNLTEDDRKLLRQARLKVFYLAEVQ